MDISSDNASFIDAVVAAGKFADAREAVDAAVHLLRNELEGTEPPSTDELTAAQWCERFEAWAAGHALLPHEADDSRQSIYAGQGE